MFVIRQKIIMRQDLRANPKVLYVFGDNLERAGMGGQAKEMRGEPNAHGIATKRRPSGDTASHFFDGQKDAKEAVLRDFIQLIKKLKDYRGLVIPLDGIGTGLARLPENAPQLLARIEEEFKILEGIYNGV